MGRAFFRGNVLLHQAAVASPPTGVEGRGAPRGKRLLPNIWCFCSRFFIVASASCDTFLSACPPQTCLFLLFVRWTLFSFICCLIGQLLSVNCYLIGQPLYVIRHVIRQPLSAIWYLIGQQDAGVGPRSDPRGNGAADYFRGKGRHHHNPQQVTG